MWIVDAIAADTTIQLEISIFNLVSNSFSQKILSHNARAVYTQVSARVRRTESARESEREARTTIKVNQQKQRK